LVYIFAATAALFTHYFAIFLFPFHAVLILILAWDRPRERVFCLLPAIPFATIIFLIRQIAASAAGNAASGPYFVSLDIMLRDLLNSFSVGTTIDLAQVWWIDLVLLALFAIGILFPDSNRHSRFSKIRFALSVLAFLFIPIVGVLVVSFVRPLYQNSRYLIAISPAFYIGVASGIGALGRR
jgi:hypothetical protein